MKSSRQMEIIDILKRDKIVSTAVLASRFNVSIETIRRDLDYLEKQYLLKKIYGGAELYHTNSENVPPLPTRNIQAHAEKEAIAEAARDLIPENITLALDAGSTIGALCQLLNCRNDLTIICTDVHNAAQLLPSGSRIYMMGGFLTLDGTSSGTQAREFLSSINDIDLFLFSTDGINPAGGITNDDTLINDLKKRLIKKSRQKILLADHTKFNTKGFYKTCDFTEIDVLITDTGTPADVIASVRDSCRVITVEPKL
ncbi:MAG: DeoR/GlpR transcriptional regulator [Firmicutes bacterium]|nr:DeoR/GlpR transcriptional regulator [Bacillota bacterium]